MIFYRWDNDTKEGGRCGSVESICPPPTCFWCTPPHLASALIAGRDRGDLGSGLKKLRSSFDFLVCGPFSSSVGVVPVVAFGAASCVAFTPRNQRSALRGVLVPCVDAWSAVANCSCGWGPRAAFVGEFVWRLPRSVSFVRCIFGAHVCALLFQCLSGPYRPLFAWASGV